MAGILDKKSRVLDAVLTPEGRRQLADGMLNVVYATFTDGEVFYSVDSTYGHEDPTNRLYIESCGLPQDQVIFEANDEGKLSPLRKQNIYINPIGLNNSGSTAPGVLKDGKVLTTEVFHGSRVKVADIKEVTTDLNRGFIYLDSAGKSGSILVDPFKLPNESFISAPVGGPYVGYVGTKGGASRVDFASQIKKVINLLSSSSGPNISATANMNVVYLSPLLNNTGSKFTLQYSGTLSSPIVLEGELVGGRMLTEELEGASFASQVLGILSSSFDNFLELRAISTIDRTLLDDKFILSNNELSFEISRMVPDKVSALVAAPPPVNAIDSLFSDDKLSRLENFLYLPPIVKISDTVATDKTNIKSLTPYLLGDYPSWGDNEVVLDYSNLTKQLSAYEFQETKILETSLGNNVIGQLFEVSNSGISKLDVIDFGEVMSPNPDDPRGVKRKVFFAGKVFLDDRGTACFVNIFTFMLGKRQGDDDT